MDDVLKEDFLEVMKILISVVSPHKYGKSLQLFKGIKSKWIVFQHKLNCWDYLKVMCRNHKFP